MQEEGMPRWQMSNTVIRVSAFGDGQTWVYQYPPYLWHQAARRIMSDLREDKLPTVAAVGLLHAVVNGVTQAN